MVELQHRRKAVPELERFLADHPSPGVDMFGHLEFAPAKKSIKAALNEDQMGLCVYCEEKLGPTDGHVEHIRPKGGKKAHPELCFTYTNLAQSCLNDKTCGQQKQNRILPIEPGPGCNRHWTIATSGRIIAAEGLTKKEQQMVRMTCDMTGLNHPELVAHRERRLKGLIEILKTAPEDEEVEAHLEDKPFRFILATVK